MEWDIQGAEGLNPQNREEVDHMVGILVDLEDALVSLERKDGAFLQFILRSGATVAINVGEGRHKTMRQLRGKSLTRAEIVDVLEAFRAEDPGWSHLLSGASDRTSAAQAGSETAGVSVGWLAGAVVIVVLIAIAWATQAGS